MLHNAAASFSLKEKTMATERGIALVCGFRVQTREDRQQQESHAHVANLATFIFRPGHFADPPPLTT